MTHWKTPILLLALAMALSVLPSSADAPPTLAALDAEIPILMQNYDVPGLALAVVQDGEIAFSRGYGVRELGGNDPVDADTLFAIGSITKSFTAACLGLGVEDGTLGWDDPIAEHLPFFALKDPWITRRVTIRDFLSHRSGLEPNNLISWDTKLGREDIVRRLRFLDINGFRSSFRYNNLAVSAAGQVLPAATGQSWDDCVQLRIFAPLGMERSTVNNKQFEGDLNVASAHVQIDGALRPYPRQDLDNDAPSGSIYSSAAEMTRWILAHVQDGTVDGKPVLPPAVIREMRAPQNPINAPDLARYAPGANLVAYGLGWNLQDYGGELAVAHGGGTRGMTAQLGMLPGRRSGFVVLSNAPYSTLPALIQYKVYDALLGIEGADWNAHFEDVEREVEAWFATFRPPAAQPGTHPSLPLDAYTGTYHNDLYGPAVVRLEDDRLSLELADLGHRATLEHFHHDTFETRWESGRHSMVGGMVPLIAFNLSVDGVIESLTPGRAIFQRVVEQ